MDTFKLIILAQNTKSINSLLLLQGMSNQETDQGPRLNTNCIICLELADQALVTACCVDIICKECYDKIKKVPNSICPKCRKVNFTANPELFIRKFIQECSLEISFFIKPVSGNSFSVRLRELDTGQMLYQRAFERTEIPVDKMLLTFGGKNIRRDKISLRRYNIKENSTVHQVGRLLGG